jgi:hypothetical protein
MLQPWKWPAQLGMAAAISVLSPAAWSQPLHAPFIIDNHHLQIDPTDPNVNISAGLSIGGGPFHYAQVDTGSVGILVSHDLLGSGAVALGESGAREFNSSGRVYQGQYYRASIELRGSDGIATTVPMRVLGVDALVCDPVRANGCRPNPHVSGFVFLGVGFDRPPFLNPPYVVRDLLGPSDNPFLQLAAMAAGEMPRRFILARDRIVLGPSDATEAAFNLVSLPGESGLAGEPAPRDWNRATASYTLSGPGSQRFVPPGGTVPLLVDTGLEYTILTMPPVLRPPALTNPGSTTFISGINVQVSVLTGTGSTNVALQYEFRTGASPTPAFAPTRVVWGINGNSTQLNTGSNLLNAYDYLYDSDRGFIGFHRR